MSVSIRGSYTGNKRIELIHEPSGTRISTAAPVDNNGDGSSFSPTDLCAGALGACILTTIAIVAERDGIDLAGSHFSVEKHMSQSPRRIARLPLRVHLPSSLGPVHRQKFENTAKTCPVHHSLHPDTEIAIEFRYDVG